MSTDFVYDEQKANAAFHAFLKWIAMDFAADGEEYDIVWDEANQRYVVVKNGKVVDDRGQLFMSIQNVFCAMYPNTQYRNAPYILNNINKKELIHA